MRSNEIKQRLLHEADASASCHQYATEKAFTLDGLSDDEAGEPLLRAARVPDAQRSTVEGDAQVVVSLLSSHPLALIQAGSSESDCSHSDRPKHIHAIETFEASAGILRASAEIIPPSSTTESARDALELLSVLATCGPSWLPLPMFEAGWKGAQRIGPDQANGDDDALRLTPWHGSRLPSFIQACADAWDSFRLIEAVHLCKVFALMSTDDHDRFLSVSMHPLIHAWARDRADRRKMEERWLPVYELTARNLVHYGKVKEAVLLLEEVVKIREQTLAEDHPSRLASQHELATIYWDLNRHNNAVHMMKHVVGIRSQVLDEQHPDRKNSEAWLEYFRNELRKLEPI
ncbi:MAG: hypothetical protein Q9166_008117 [cf. Caloplaca sp. 2 TL-2023]